MLTQILLIMIIIFTVYNVSTDYMGVSPIQNLIGGNYSQNKCTYFFHPVPKTYIEHEEAARQLGGNLVSIHSKTENEKIRQIAQGQKIFIGGFRNKKGGPDTIYDKEYWKWNDNSDWSYTNWNSDWESYVKSGGQPFVEMIENGTWNDVYNKYNYKIKRAAVYKINCDATNGIPNRVIKNYCESEGGELVETNDCLMLVKKSNHDFKNYSNKKQEDLGISENQTDDIIKISDNINNKQLQSDNPLQQKIPSLKYDVPNDAYPELKKSTCVIRDKNYYDIDTVSESGPNSGTTVYPLQHFNNPLVNINSNQPIVTANSLESRDNLSFSVVDNISPNINNDTKMETQKEINYHNRHSFIKKGRKFMLDLSRKRNVVLPHIKEDEYEEIGKCLYEDNNSKIFMEKVNKILEISEEEKIYKISKKQNPYFQHYKQSDDGSFTQEPLYNQDYIEPEEQNELY